MGTKLRQINNLFTTLQKNNCNVANVGLKTSDIRAVSENISLKVSILGGLNQFKRWSMERLLECYDRDSIRNTMLKQEDIFRQQVHELHRLYRVQKMLMAKLGNKKMNLHSFPSEAATAAADTCRTRIWSSASTSDISHSSHVSNVHQSAARLNSEYSSLNHCSPRAGPSSRELSICSRDPSSVHIKGFDLEQPATSINDQTTIFGKQLKEEGSNKGPLPWTDDGSEIELTLSMGSSSDKKKPTHNWLHPNSDAGCSLPNSGSDTRTLLSSRPVGQERGEECGDSSSGMDRENLKSPPWLLRAFNLNNT